MTDDTWKPLHQPTNRVMQEVQERLPRMFPGEVGAGDSLGKTDPIDHSAIDAETAEADRTTARIERAIKKIGEKRG